MPGSIESIKNAEEEPGSPPISKQYDFEKMIEEAMKAAGEKPAVVDIKPKERARNPKGSGAGPPVVSDL